MSAPAKRGSGAAARLAALVLVALVAGCAIDTGSRVVRPEVPWGATLALACAEGRAMTVQFVPDPPSARVALEDGAPVTLRQVPAANDAKFSDGATTLYVQGDLAVLEVTGQIVRRGCRAR
ncbi:MAG: MliC family protein [Burkholderiales bacterium]|nr:MliC family protein [Burkholderiales bacterium]